MLTICKKIQSELIIKKSKFIAYLFPIDTKKQIEDNLKQIKKQHPNASHICYAYLLEQIQKATDDKEPAGTAGIPMLSFLKQKELDHILAIVVRYFGGTLLGTGGLIRAYQKSVQQALEQAEKKEIIKRRQYQITFPYSLEKKINFLLKNENILVKTYDHQVTYIISISLETYDQLKRFKMQIKEM